MFINYFIKKAEQNTSDKGGGNKKCFLVDDYALLYGSYKEEELKKQIQIGKSLEQQDVNILPTLEYKTDTEPNVLGYVKGYSLQRRAQGEELYNSKMSEDEYKKRLSTVANMSTQQMDKFASDWIAISEAGLMIDPSKCENFFYSDGKISFIDLNVWNNRPSLDEHFLNMSQVLFGLGLKSKYKADENDFAKILTNVSRSFLKKGLPLEDIQKVSSKYTYFMSEGTINSVMNTLSKETSKDTSLIYAMAQKSGISGR